LIKKHLVSPPRIDYKGGVAERTIFPNAPITEALLDIRAQLPAQANLAQLATYHDSVKDLYPTKRERHSWQGGFKLNPPGDIEVLQSQGGPDGYLFTSTDGKQIVQARLDGFTFNRLKPYDRWETFRDEARRLWQLYVRVADPKQVTRAALRYINRIEIPLPMKDFKDYILTLPEIAPGLPQGLDKFLMQLVIPLPDTPAKAVITATMEAVTDTDKLPLIFDIDVFRVAAFNVTDEEVWQVFEELHDLKNNIFFESITPKAKELFQ
jgi:uncharacterized protein (TIGR04255 family)